MYIWGSLSSFFEGKEATFCSSCASFKRSGAQPIFSLLMLENKRKNILLGFACGNMRFRGVSKFKFKIKRESTSKAPWKRKLSSSPYGKVCQWQWPSSMHPPAAAAVDENNIYLFRLKRTKTKKRSSKLGLQGSRSAEVGGGRRRRRSHKSVQATSVKTFSGNSSCLSVDLLTLTRSITNHRACRSLFLSLPLSHTEVTISGQ